MPSSVGDIDLDVPRDRAGTFSPTLVRTGQRRLGGLESMIISLYAGDDHPRYPTPPSDYDRYRAIKGDDLEDH